MILFLIFVVTAVTLTVLLWAGTLFLQGYIYTEPTAGISWQAPATAAGLAGFLTLWCLLIANSEDASPQNLPYDTLLGFSPVVDKVKAPVPELWVEPAKKLAATRGKEPIKFEYRARDKVYKAADGTGWPRSGVAAVRLKIKNEEMRFELRPPPTGSDYAELVAEGGWVMKVFEDGPTGVPQAFRWGRFLMNLLLNFLHLGLWFAGLWLVLRFTWPHALGLGLVLWLVMMLTILPMLFEQAALLAQRRGKGDAAGTQLFFRLTAGRDAGSFPGRLRGPARLSIE